MTKSGRKVSGPAGSGAPPKKGKTDGKGSRAPPKGPEKPTGGDAEMEVDEHPVPDGAWMWVGAGSSALMSYAQRASGLFVEGRVLGRFLAENDESQTRLAALVSKAFTPGPLPSLTVSGPNGVEWHRTTGTGLLEDETGGFRTDGHSVIVFGHPRTFWPPILEPGSAGSLSWTFTAVGLTEDEGRAVCRGLGDDTWGAHYCFRRLTDGGRKTHDFVVVAAGPPADAAATYEVEGKTLTLLRCCSFCMRNGAKMTLHETSQCPVLSMQDKLRGNAGLRPIDVLDHSFNFATGERAVDVPKLVAELEKRIDGLEKELKTLKEAVKTVEPKKRKAAADDKPGPSKKEKKDSAGGGSKGGKGKQVAK